MIYFKFRIQGWNLTIEVGSPPGYQVIKSSSPTENPEARKSNGDQPTASFKFS